MRKLIQEGIEKINMLNIFFNEILYPEVDDYSKIKPKTILRKDHSFPKKEPN